jgi:nucleoside-triphosphatase THEP1
VLEHSVFETAVEFVNNTSRSIFLTGKAGTGKTTFLKYIRDNTPKKCIVVAPTGVAAINAGGVTMHSMFQLPLGPYIPVTIQNNSDSTATDKYSLFKNLRLSQEKRDIIRDVNLIIIDEVSMVRSDTLDAMDAILRYVRRKPNKVFGGAQVLFIGDLLQLPPVMPEQEWSVLREYYKSPYFFDSNAVQQSDIVYLELKKIFRQSDQTFIDILNRIRNAEPTNEDLQNLNGRLNSRNDKSKDYITLTSHNYKADRINQEN